MKKQSSTSFAIIKLKKRPSETFSHERKIRKKIRENSRKFKKKNYDKRNKSSCFFFSLSLSLYKIHEKEIK